VYYIIQLVKYYTPQLDVCDNSDYACHMKQNKWDLVMNTDLNHKYDHGVGALYESALLGLFD
jgi:hypothetical protein